ncbi:DUF4920 domain-containing protein [Rubricoccus marinus]|uniref:DUF4920 domain-containing protein n=1 Tax=Rubricoccus marinus TaxID=716817 RepID=A0A259U092_9BACT|nr:DUF4920 domain-containing protein [Rubricoccus marinus]OZC03443.1 hypothetical protein BSZ36_10895 [Rubricoccus marinus]
MRRFLLLPALALAFTACSSESDAPEAAGDDVAVASDAPDAGDAMAGAETTVGEPLGSDLEILPVSSVIEQASDLDGETLVVEGTVSKICQVKGCWLTLQNEAGETFRVAVPKDDAGEYVFTFPMDVTGATAQLAGTFSVEEESVEDQKHLAEDEGQSPEAIEAITAPKRTYVLTASGARLTRA